MNAKTRLGERLKAADRFCADLSRQVKGGRRSSSIGCRASWVRRVRRSRNRPRLRRRLPRRIRRRSPPRRRPLPSVHASAWVRSPHDPLHSRFPTDPGRPNRDDLVCLRSRRSGLYSTAATCSATSVGPHRRRHRHHRHDPVSRKAAGGSRRHRAMRGRRQPPKAILGAGDVQLSRRDRLGRRQGRAGARGGSGQKQSCVAQGAAH